ncbi:MAG: 16S rRNA (cytosine(1402)-N(4))-methyltransferase RsmH [Candidatus Omnitrophica bacterium]|nr:16S rRNA (cytosine(1402)-N(4))-methyltransferase RsmH [Candidatus Omnitrophota bacterium]
MTKITYQHIPVMCTEILEYLKLGRDQTILDCTLGLAAHAEAILQQLGPGGRLIGIDQDQEALQAAKDRLGQFNNCILLQGNFRNIDIILDQLKIDKVDAIVFDLGVSSLHLDQATRGFSFKLDAPLDMRMDKSLRLSAFDLVNFLPQEKLSDILRRFGEVRWHHRIARAIVRERKKTPIVNTAQLADLISRVTPRRIARIHPATTTFQALRIAVNDELEALKEALVKCLDYARVGARICVISFHSLEDRIVKMQFRALASEGKLRIITKKPLKPTEQEIRSNPRSRSAKLRVGERI